MTPKNILYFEYVSSKNMVSKVFRGVGINYENIYEPDQYISIKLMMHMVSTLPGMNTYWVINRLYIIIQDTVLQ